MEEAHPSEGKLYAKGESAGGETASNQQFNQKSFQLLMNH